jgi:hypothetical protein
MLELVLSSCFAAFFLAVIEQLIDLRIYRAIIALALSAVGVGLTGVTSMPLFIVTTVAGGFLSPFLVVLADSVTSYRPAVTQPTRLDR